MISRREVFFVSRNEMGKWGMIQNNAGSVFPRRAYDTEITTTTLSSFGSDNDTLRHTSDETLRGRLETDLSKQEEVLSTCDEE